MNKKREPQWQEERLDAMLRLGFSTSVFIWLNKPDLQGFSTAVFFMVLTIVTLLFFKIRF